MFWGQIFIPLRCIKTKSPVKTNKIEWAFLYTAQKSSRAKLVSLTAWPNYAIIRVTEYFRSYFYYKEGNKMQFVNSTNQQNFNKNIPLIFYRGGSMEKVL